MDDKGFVTRNPGSTPLGMQSQGGGMGSPIQQAVGMAIGGIMNADIIGGMMDGNMDEMGRQMYGPGELCKSSYTEAVKKVAKSPIGKAALLNFAPALIPGGASLFLEAVKLCLVYQVFYLKKGLSDFFFAGKDMALKNLTQKGLMTGIAGLSALPFIFKGDDEEEFDPYRGPSIDIANIRNNPYNFLAPRFEGSQFAADGGRIGYQKVEMQNL